MEKTALVLAGGGSRGAYEIGVWRALRELDEPVSIITGTSVGALNAAAIATCNDDKIEQLWREIYTSRIFDIELDESLPTRERFYHAVKEYGKAAATTGGAGTNGLQALLEHYIDESAVRNSPYEVGIVTVEFPIIKPYYLWLEDIPQGKLIEYLIASCALFPAVHPKKIADKTFIDGGYIDNFPLEMALQKGATQIICVGLTPSDLKKSTQFKHCPIRMIYSHRYLGSQLFFDPEASKTNIRYGYLDTMRSYGIYDGRDYALSKGSIITCVKKHYGAFFHLLSLCGIQTSGKSLQTAAYKALRHQAKKQSGHTSVSGFALAGMESAAALLSLPDQAIYTLDRLNSRLHTALEQIPLPAQVRDARSLPAMQAALLLTKPDIRLKAIARLLKNAMISQKPMNLFPIAALYPMEFIAAIYLSLLHI